MSCIQEFMIRRFTVPLHSKQIIYKESQRVFIVRLYEEYQIGLEVRASLDLKETILHDQKWTISQVLSKVRSDIAPLRPGSSGWVGYMRISQV